MPQEKELLKNRLLEETFIELGSLLAVYTVSYLLSARYNLVSSAIMIFASISYFIYFSISGERSFLKLKSVFSGAWLFTIGLAQLRLLEYQVAWASIFYMVKRLPRSCFFLDRK